MATGDDSLACFIHEHYYYVFSMRPRCLIEIVQEPVCSKTIILSNSTFISICEDKACTCVCDHPNPSAAHNAIIPELEKKVSTVQELLNLESTAVPISLFASTDFNWLNTGIFVPLPALTDSTTSGHTGRGMTVTLKKEVSRNEVVQEFIKQKLGDNFIVFDKPATRRKGRSFSPYSRSKHDLCIMHKQNHFKTESGTFTAAVVGASTTMETEESQEDDGDIFTSLIEFKTTTFSRDQILAEMICTLTDCSVDVLSRGKQINRAMIYGLSVNYSTGTSVMYNMCMDFIRNSLNIVTLPTELAMSDSLNFLISALSK